MPKEKHEILEYAKVPQLPENTESKNTVRITHMTGMPERLGSLGDSKIEA